MSDLHQFAICPYCARSTGKGSICLDFDSLVKELRWPFNTAKPYSKPGWGIAEQPKVLRFDHEGAQKEPCPHTIVIWCGLTLDGESTWFQYRSPEWTEHDPDGSGWLLLRRLAISSPLLSTGDEHYTVAQCGGIIPVPPEYRCKHSELLVHFSAMFAENVRTFVIAMEKMVEVAAMIPERAKRRFDESAN